MHPVHRVIVAALLAVTLPGSFSTAAGGEVHRIGVVLPGEHWVSSIDGLKEGMKHLGYVEGQNVEYLIDNAQGDKQRVAEATRHFVAKKVDVNTITNTALKVVIAATQPSRTPVVFGSASGPVESGIIPAYATPDAHVTGVTSGRRPLAFAGFLIGVAAAIAATGAGPKLAHAHALERVAVQLKWHHQTQFAGFYVAEDRGFYREDGVVVDLRPWKVGTASPIEQVASGAAAFGITSQTEFLVAREKGLPVVAVAAVYQKSPVGFFALKTSGIKHPRDFPGKTIAFAPTHEIHLEAMLRRFRLDRRALRRMPYGFDLTPFLKGEVAIWAGYIMNQPVDARLAGYDVTVIFPDDYGVHTYDDIIFTSDDVARQKPRLVERWLRATLRGWRYAIEHPDEATEITLRVDPTLKREKQAAMLLASIPLIHTGQVSLGWMTRGVWEDAHRLLLDQKILARPLKIESAYTLQFLEKASGTGSSAPPR